MTGMSEKIVVSELIWPVGLEVLKGYGRTVYDPGLSARPEVLAAEIRESCALVVRNQTKVGPDLLDSAPQLRVIGRLGAGLENIDLRAARARNVQVVYSPAGNTISVAEMTFAMILALAKKLIPADRGVRGGHWDRSGMSGVELWGKNLGILGLGRTGLQVSLRARAFGMKVLAYHPRLAPDHPRVIEAGAELVDRETLFRRSDFLSVHLPLTEATQGFAGRAELSLMKPSACLINTSRGEVVDEAALYDALVRGRLAGAALDVRAAEPPISAAADRCAKGGSSEGGQDGGGGAMDESAMGEGAEGGLPPLERLDNVISTPHVAGLTLEAQARVSESVALDVVRALRGEAPEFPAY